MNGLLLIDKPQDFTSFDVVAVVRKILRTKKVGHTGTLDPFATGVLPIMVGSCTKLCDILPVSQKRYTATVTLGLLTDTLDITGKVISRSQTHFTCEEIALALNSFRGEISQVPPMYSAIKINGVRMYDLARAGIEVERTARLVTISNLELIEFNEKAQTFVIDVTCSKGTYIRSLALDIGVSLGSTACVSVLNRSEACGYDSSQCVALSDLRADETPERFVLPVEKAIEGFRSISVSQKQAHRFINGGWLDLSRLTTHDLINDEFISVFDEQTLLGIGHVDKQEGCIKMKCLLNR